MPNYKYAASNLNPTLMPGASGSDFAGLAGAPGGINRDPVATEVTQRIRDLAVRVKAGDPAAIAEVQQLSQPDLDHTDDPTANWARDISNTFLGTQLKSRYDASGILHDLAPGLAIAGGALGLGLLAPAAGAAGGGAAAAGGGGIAAAPSTAFLGAANAGAASAASGGLGGLLGAGGAAGAAGGGLGIAGAAKALGGLKGALSDYAPLVLGGVQALTGAAQQGKANDLQREALNYARNDYNSRAGFRDAASARLLGPQAQREDLSALYAPAQNNPYAVRRPPLAAPPPRPIDGAPLPPPQVMPSPGADFGRLPHAPRRV